jgi:hypothetical protein
MQYVWAQKLLKSGQLTGLAMNTGWQMPDSTVNYLLTAGFNVTSSLSKKFQFIGSFYYQVGRDRTDKTVKAWMFSSSFLYSGLKKIPITLGVDVLSGTNKGDRNSTAFDPLFGTNHAFYGYMDYFYVGSPHAQQGATVGLTDIFVKTSLKTGQKSSLLLHAHEFLAQVNIIDPENSARHLPLALGTEIDAILNYEYDKAVNIKLGYSQLLPTQSMQAIKGGDRDKIQQWAWLMLTVKPALFTSAPKETTKSNN